MNNYVYFSISLCIKCKFACNISWEYLRTCKNTVAQVSISVPLPNLLFPFTMNTWNTDIWTIKIWNSRSSYQCLVMSGVKVHAFQKCGLSLWDPIKQIRVRSVSVDRDFQSFGIHIDGLFPLARCPLCLLCGVEQGSRVIELR